MAKLRMTIEHKLSQEEALKRIQDLLEELKKEFECGNVKDLREYWTKNSNEFSFSVAGFSVSGKLTIGSTQVEIAGNLPFVASFLKGKIEKTIRERAEILLA